MKLVVILLMIVIIMLVSYLFLVKKALRSITKQLDHLTTTNSNSVINSDFSDSTINQMINSVNKSLQLKLEAERARKRANQTQQETILYMSHDLKTPLTSIKGYLKLVALDVSSEAECEKYLGIIGSKIMVLTKLINEFFELSKIESDDYSLKWESVNLYPIIAEKLATFYDEFEKKQMTVTVNLDDNLVVYVDVTVVNRIIDNLLINMLKHGASKVAINGYKNNNLVIIECSNTAPELTNNHLPHLFEKFYTESQRRGNQNTGLGLFITKELVERLSGSIDAQLSDNILTIVVKFPSQ